MKLFRTVCYVLAVVCILIVVYYRVWFLRQPERKIVHNNQVFVSPANGVVVSIREWRNDTLNVDKGLLGHINVWTKDVDTAGTIISIQMDPTNVHFQRSPLACKVLATKHTEGDFNNAIVMSNEYGIRFENEHNEMLFKSTEGYNYKLVQVAGFLARRIEDFIEPGQELKQGDVIGLIKFGSQVTVILPSNFKVTTKVKDVVTDGETVIAEIK